MNIDRIFQLVISATNVDPNKVKGKTRLREIVKPRQVFCWLAAKYTNTSLVDIGSFLGGKHHTSIMYHVRQINDLISIHDEETLHLLDIITELIKKDNNSTYIIEIVLPNLVDIYEVEKYLKSKYIVHKIV
jgi:chromosomal replication initiator protein